MNAPHPLTKDIAKAARLFSTFPQDFTPLLSAIGNARFVLIGEATHGTEEFYACRAELTKILIRDFGFSAVTIEGDWPDAFRVNLHVRGDRQAPDAAGALSGFRRFPSWMWRNGVTARFVDWLDHENHRRQAAKRVGFYGLDLYSLHASIEAVVAYLERVDPSAAARARHHYGCFDQAHAERPQDYGFCVLTGMVKSCEDDVVRELAALRRRAADYMGRNVGFGPEAFFSAEQNAKAVIGAELYYRAMFSSRVSSWNIRDRHMSNTLNAIAGHLTARLGRPARIIVWAHNSHVGDARATEFGERGEVTLGQLMREQHGETDTRLIGLSTAVGTVTAATRWDEMPQTMAITPPDAETYEGVFATLDRPAFLLFPRDNPTLAKHLDLPRLQRAIGVVYRPETERHSHYYFAALTRQFDALIHINRTTALHPITGEEARERTSEPPETYPTGM